MFSLPSPVSRTCHATLAQNQVSFTLHVLPYFLQDKPPPAPADQLCTPQAGPIQVEEDVSEDVSVLALQHSNM